MLEDFVPSTCRFLEWHRQYLSSAELAPGGLNLRHIDTQPVAISLLSHAAKNQGAGPRRAVHVFQGKFVGLWLASWVLDVLGCRGPMPCFRGPQPTAAVSTTLALCSFRSTVDRCSSKHSEEPHYLHLQGCFADPWREPWKCAVIIVVNNAVGRSTQHELYAGLHDISGV